MLAVLSVIASISLGGILFCSIKLIKINRIKSINVAEPRANKKWRRVLIWGIILCTCFFMLAVSFFFSIFS